ncbi:MAG: hypothetical protein ACLTKI_09420 [Lachnospiraceae bacterium]
MEEKKRLEEQILAMASELPLEKQEQVLDVIKGMLFTRQLLQKSQEMPKTLC